MTKACLTSNEARVRDGPGVKVQCTCLGNPDRSPTRATLLEHRQSLHPQRFLIPARTVRRLCPLRPSARSSPTDCVMCLDHCTILQPSFASPRPVFGLFAPARFSASPARVSYDPGHALSLSTLPLSILFIVFCLETDDWQLTMSRSTHRLENPRRLKLPGCSLCCRMRLEHQILIKRGIKRSSFYHACRRTDPRKAFPKVSGLLFARLW